MSLDTPILLTLLLAAVSPWLFAAGRRGFLLTGVLLHAGHLLYYIGQLAAVAGGETRTTHARNSWFPTDLVAWSFSGNPWALIFAVMISGIGLLIFIYAVGYFGAAAKARRFFAPLLAFEATMLGLVLADDAVLLFLFWELTSITSFFLIGFHHDDFKSRWNALQALLVTGLGGVAMLAGFLMLGHQWGTLSLTDWRAEVAAGAIPSVAPLVLILLGAMTKSALFPFFFWLPNAMSAPTPVSGFLHSATMVKAGIYLVGALHPLLETSRLILEILVISGGLTALAGLILG
ncbi:MAG: proton-conducting transporter membrane subunit, partial [Verrucomicrobiota bacterium JB025]|nr:proton-conducting transporter membrane subunit [Verrucomicrobiota bacterium JB025]